MKYDEETKELLETYSVELYVEIEDNAEKEYFNYKHMYTLCNIPEALDDELEEE